MSSLKSSKAHKNMHFIYSQHLISPFNHTFYFSPTCYFLVFLVPGRPTVLCGRGQQERDRWRGRSGGAEK